MNKSMRWWLALFGLTVTALVGTTRPAWADNIDAELYKEAPKILKFLQQEGYKNVATLNFRVKKGNKPISFQAGPLNSNMADRLENLLVLTLKDERSLGVIHDASGEASKKNLPAYTSPKGRERLFATRFPLAWGTEKGAEIRVAPDVFLTGQVIASPDMRKTTVIIEAFDKSMIKSGKFTRVTEFTVKPDRAVLADLGQSFAIPRGKLRRGGEEVDLAAEDSAASADQTSTEPTPPTTPMPHATPAGLPVNSPDKPVELEIMYDGQVQQIVPDPDNPGELKIEEPREGQKVMFGLKNICNEQIGVVLKINGFSTWQEQTEEPASCKKWILDPGERIELAGFYEGPSSFVPFRVLSDAESAAVAYTDNLGLIQLFAFRPEQDSDTQKKITLPRGMSPKQTAKTPRARSLKERKEQISKARPRGLMGKDLAAGPKVDRVQEVPFPATPQLQYSLAVRYYKPKQ